jgi:hypothetical protein
MVNAYFQKIILNLKKNSFFFKLIQKGGNQIELIWFYCQSKLKLIKNFKTARFQKEKNCWGLPGRFLLSF